MVFDNFVDIYKCFGIIEKSAKEYNAEGILRCKDRFNADIMPFGYRDLLINIYCPESNIVCEIQLHHIMFYQYKSESHRMYKKARLFEQEDRNLAYEYADKHSRKHIGNKLYEIDMKERDEQKSSDIDTDLYDLMKEWKLEQYAHLLIDDGGFDEFDGWIELNVDDMINMGFKPGHARKFVRMVKQSQSMNQEVDPVSAPNEPEEKQSEIEIDSAPEPEPEMKNEYVSETEPWMDIYQQLISMGFEDDGAMKAAKKFPFSLDQAIDAFNKLQKEKQRDSKHKVVDYDNMALPEFWIKLWSYDDGKWYYQNEITKHTQWEHPIKANNGWRKCKTKDDKIYYQNEITKVTQWIKPHGFKD